MRLFTAIDLPAQVVHSLTDLIGRLKPTARIKWSPAENLHVTTKFIGEWPDERLEELRSALRTQPPCGPITIEVRGLGFFPNPHSPRVFFAAVNAPPSFAALAHDTDEVLARLGVPAEKRPYSPHLTLARIKEPVPLQRLQQTIAALDSLEFGNFKADRFYLYQSRSNPAGSVYTQFAEFLL
jgi:RNA 2',3'-cyclic 3'-phosphodiesterase